jgi:hypothetical protein
MIKKINKLYLYINKPVKETILFFLRRTYIIQAVSNKRNKRHHQHQQQQQ